MNKEKAATIFRKNYSAPDYLIESVDLFFELFEEKTRVTAKSTFYKSDQGSSENSSITLSGEELQLISIKIDGQLLHSTRYDIDDKALTINGLPHSFSLEIVTEIDPSRNTSLEGLYRSSGNYCTQCEPEGFRKITYYLDRPDVLARFTTRIEGDKDLCPVMLSNGNCIAKGELSSNRHYIVWQDPFPKPCYLFALVAGKLVSIEDEFITSSGRKVDLQIYVEERNKKKCSHAMASLKKAMKWDEDIFGLEYDLEIYMIVAVDDFNMGAMENKGLNIFNSKYVLSTPETATDDDYIGIEGVIAHEYFHNWTGNRVTCRDWFQLSLKEGLTVFRDQEFSSDMNSRTVERIQNVRILKNFQFREDSGPMAHAVRPESYQEINNFYTVTVYNKGAEVIRMMYTLLGPDAFHKGMALYFERHDGQAVTCDDFVAAMSDSSGVDLSQFKNWYSQSGTPLLKVEGEWNGTNDEYNLTIRQSCPPTPGQKEKEPFHLPLAVGLVGKGGKDLIGNESSTTAVLQLKEKKQVFSFQNIYEKPVVSFLRDFSAPVRIEPFQNSEELAILMKHDSNRFNRWEASSQLAATMTLDIVDTLSKEGEPIFNELYFDGVEHSLTTTVEDPALLALSLQLPSETTLAQELEVVDPDALYRGRQLVKTELANRYSDKFLYLYKANITNGEYQITPDAMGKRSLKNTTLSYLMSLDPLPADILQLCVDQYRQATNMTDTIAALKSIVNLDKPIRQQLLGDFYNKWQNEPLVMDKWFTLQALSSLRDTLKNVEYLLDDKLFSMKNPNKVRALIGAFCGANHFRFHDISGAGYLFLGDMILQLNGINPQIAARLVTPLINWKRYDKNRQTFMKDQLDRIAAHKGLSADVAEIVNKSR